MLSSMGPVIPEHFILNTKPHAILTGSEVPAVVDEVGLGVVVVLTTVAVVVVVPAGLNLQTT